MKFKPVEIEDYPALVRFFRSQPYRHSNYSLFSIVVWSDQAFRTGYAAEGDCVVFMNESTLIPEDRHLYLPVCGGKIPTAAELKALAVEAGVGEYRFVPEHYLKSRRPGEVEGLFRVEAQAEFDDYVYLAQDIATLRGNRYKQKRNHIHQFVREYEKTGRVAVEPLSQERSREYLEFLEKWCEIRDCDADENYDLACERKAAATALENIDRLEVRGIAVRIDGAVSAFGIASPVTEDMGVLNFEKAFPDVKGLYQFLDRECARRLFAGCRYVNKESDMGLPNLAGMKKSYHPIMMEKCFRLVLR